MAEEIELLSYPKEYQPYIDRAPVAPEQMYRNSTANDKATINSWKNDWIANYKSNQEKYGPFYMRSLGELFQAHLHKPAVIIGSGPHLKRNAHLLKDAKGMVIISCLHNFHFLEDLGVNVDYYVTLDAGPITVEEVTEGGDPFKDYWKLTESKTLLAYAATHPSLLKKWRGKVLFFNAPVPDAGITEALEKIEKFNTHVSNGGNVLGACMYIAKGYLGCSTIIFTGASFSFDSGNKFHGWNSKYDANVGHVLRVPDIFGYKAKTWPSYYNFANWFNWVAEQVPGEYINCTEGGVLGAYESGNIRSIKQMDLKHCLERFGMSEHLREQAQNPGTDNVKILF